MKHTGHIEVDGFKLKYLTHGLLALEYAKKYKKHASGAHSPQYEEAELLKWVGET